MESSGAYPLPLYHFLLNHEKARTSNPVLIKKFHDGQTLRRTKTDALDAVTIARYAQSHMASLQEDRMQLNSESWILARAMTMLTFLCLFGPAKEVLAASDEELEQALQIKKKRKSDNISAEHTRSLVQRSIKVSYRAAMVHDSAKLVLAYQKRDEELIAAHFLSEVPDISQFATYQKPIAFAKTDPGIYESGNTSKARKISKRGNPQLRKYLYLMADRCKRH